MAEIQGLEELRVEVKALADELAALKRSVATADDRIKMSMKDKICCPYCGGRRIARFNSIADRAHGGGVVELSLKIEDRGMWRSDRFSAFQAFVCVECGVVELRLEDTSALTESTDDFEILTSETPEVGPYR